VSVVRLSVRCKIASFLGAALTRNILKWNFIDGNRKTKQHEMTKKHEIKTAKIDSATQAAAAKK
jgi:hypothetical protein